ncbi:protein TRC8 homolog [Orussus abietinus]|uniref:protein TRC8 homolog n=1 Tax=Orussus abietinus TaxID=222816 RepID=UPI000C7160F5|nr:protein TRC8 homolog [Orussus abietinus]XP_023289225.1 protein TRC8 homolog [Orussus abietinus]
MDTTMRSKVLKFADVIMRVPALFIIDELLRIGLGFPGEGVSDTFVGSFVATPEPFTVQAVNSTHYTYQAILLSALKVNACILGLVAALCIFMLWTKHLVIVYLYLTSVGIIFISYWSNVSTMKAIVTYMSSHETSNSILDDILCLNLSEIMNNGPGFLIIQNYILQCMLASVFCYIHLAPKYSIIQKLLVLSFMAPSIVGVHPLPVRILIS